MLNCSKDKKDVAGISDMQILAEKISNLHYETLSELLSKLSEKLKIDSKKNSEIKQYELNRMLIWASMAVQAASRYISEAWNIRKSYTQNDNVQ